MAEQQTWRERLPSELALPFLFGVDDPAELAERLSLDVEGYVS